MMGINRNPGTRDLRIFGMLLAVFVIVAGVVVGARTGSFDLARYVWGGGGLVTAAYFLFPRIRRRFYLGWMYATFPIGWLVSRTILAVVFYGIVTPVGLALRLSGYDPMNRRRAPNPDSYWEPHDSERKPEDYFRQF